MIRAAIRTSLVPALLLLSAASSHAVTAGDKYLCYQALTSKLPTQTKFTGVEINLIDRFLPSGRNFSAYKFNALCNPDGSQAPNIHQVQLAIKDSKLNPNSSKFVAPTTTFQMSDQFVTNFPFKVGKFSQVRVRSSKIDYGPITKCKVDADCSGGDTCQSGTCLPPDITPPAVPSTDVDNFTCYKIKLGAKTTGILPQVVSFTDEFGNFGDYTVKKITEFCTPANKDGETPGAETHPSQLTCYQVKAVKGAPKFLARKVVTNNANVGARYLDVKKQTEMCVPSTLGGGGTTPTSLLLTADNPGGVCGNLATNMAGEGVPLRRDPASPLTDPNAACTGSGAPKACCTAAGAGHCDERNTIVCGSLSFGGGGASVGSPGGESPNSPGTRTRYSLACPNATGTCTISGNAGDLPNGINCSNTGCGVTTPIDTSSPVKVCAVTKLTSAAGGTLDLSTGNISLNNPTGAEVHILTTTSYSSHGCPRCRQTTATNSPEVFSTGPSTPGTGVCDADAANSGTTCFVFEPAGPTQGLSANCNAAGSGSATIAINTTSTTAGASMSDPAGHFCPGQGGNADCTAAGTPNACCSGPGAGNCSNFDGCFGSGKFADTPATCTGVSVTGTAAGALSVGGTPSSGSFGDVACIPGVNSGSPVLDGLVNNSAGLPGPVATSTKTIFEVD